MSDGRRSFWASVPGVVAGVAGLLTAVVGLITLLVQLDVIGGGDASDGPTTTVAGSPSAEVPTFTLSPATLEFKPTDPRRKDVTVKNTSKAATLVVPEPQLTGTDSRLFTADVGTCTRAPLAAGLSCTLTVTFSPKGPLGNYNATLQVAPAGARAEEIQVKAASLL